MSGAMGAGGSGGGFTRHLVPRPAGGENEIAILTALQKAQSAARSVARRGRNAADGYSFATAEDMITEAKALLSKQGLAVIPRGSHTTGSGSSLALVVSWALIHKTHGLLELGSYTWPVVIERHRALDKAFAAADTALLAYFLRDLLQLPRTEQDTGLDDEARAQDIATAALITRVERLYTVREVGVDIRRALSLALLGRHPKTPADFEELAFKIEEHTTEDLAKLMGVPSEGA